MPVWLAKTGVGSLDYANDTDPLCKCVYTCAAGHKSARIFFPVSQTNLSPCAAARKGEGREGSKSLQIISRGGVFFAKLNFTPKRPISKGSKAIEN